MRPLLLAHSIVCEGPWTPTKGLGGVVTVQGLVPGEDEIEIRFRDVQEELPDVVNRISEDGSYTLVLIGFLLKARHIKASGAEVFVWVS